MRPVAPLAILAVLASPAVADQATTVHATAARSGAGQGFAIASRAFDDGFRVEVLDSGPDSYSQPLHIGLTDGHTYWTASQTLDAVKSDCGAGKCITSAITRESFEEVDGIAWIRFEVVNEIDHNDPDASDHDITTHTTAVMGCRLSHDKAAPRCAWFQPKNVFQSSHVAISGTTVTVTSNTGEVETVELSFS